MNDEQVLPELDARAASAATALRAYVDGLDLPATPPRRRPHQRGLLAAAALLVIALVAAAAWVAHDDQGHDIKTVDHPTPLYLFPEHVPDGVRLSGGGEFSGSGGAFTVLAPADVYAGANRDEILVTWTQELGSGQLTQALGGHPITVNGHRGTTSATGDFRAISFRPEKGRTVTIAGRGPVADGLLALAERASTRGNQVVFPDGVIPDDLERLGAIPLDRLTLPTFYATPGVISPGEGHALGWVSTDQKRTVIVVVQEAGPVDDQVLGLFDREVRHVTVAGHDAVVSRNAPSMGADGRAVAWVEDGHLVRVVTTGFDAQVAIDVAGSLREISHAEFEQRSQVPPPPGTEVIAKGGEDSGRWRVSLDKDQSLCVERNVGSECGGPNDAGLVEVDDEGKPTLVIGTGPPGSKVDVLDGGRSLLAADPVELHGLVYFVGTVPDGVASVTFTVDDGHGVDRRTVRTDQGSNSSSGPGPTTTTTTP